MPRGEFNLYFKTLKSSVVHYILQFQFTDNL